ncbi:MAG: CoA transferase [bacterium]|nr:CoA transferase [bacterium]
MSELSPLAGLRIVDLADGHGELCGRLLADLGADVTRIEPPGGAQSRNHPPLHRGESLHFACRNFNKRGRVLDLNLEDDRAVLHGLLESSDVLIESSAPGTLAGLGLDPSELCENFPHLIVTSISHFGQTGPYRDWLATDSVLAAMGGMVFKAGLPEKDPLIPPATMAEDTAATAAAYATLLAYWQRLKTGHGQHLDVSSVEAVAQTIDWSFPSASAAREATGLDAVEVRAGSGPIYKIYACKTGYVRLVILSPRQWRSMREWIGDPEDLQDPGLDSFIARIMIAPRLAEVFTEHFASMTMEEASIEAQKRGIVCTPVLTPDEVPKNEHLVSRKTFVETEVAPGLRGPIAAGFFEFDGARQGFRKAAPALGANETEPGAPRPKPETPRPAAAQPLTGLRVLDFGIGGVGVEAGRLLAEYGADVLKIESRSYPDFIRVVIGGEMCAPFASSSRSKRGFGVDAKSPEGIAILQRLVTLADIVIENNSTGTMENLGLGFTKLRELNPGVSLISSQLLGSRGAWADWIGYGPSTQPLGGLTHLWNYDDQDFPAGAGSIFPDHFAGRLCAIAALSCLIRRERTNAGSHAEIAQIESVIGMLDSVLLKSAFEPGSERARGNRNERGSPWGVYPCEGEQQWCVITVRNDAEWLGLREAVGDQDWALDPALESAQGRIAAHDRIDQGLREWTRTFDKNELARTLQEHGVPSGPVFTGTNQLDDPHFQARGFPRLIEQQELGKLSLEGPFFKASGIPEPIISQAPLIGEHTREVCSELLGMNDAEIDRLFAAGVLEGPKSE